MGKTGDRRLSIPTLSGGINTDMDPTLIGDNELATSENMDWRNGVLCARKALQTADTKGFCGIDVTDMTVTQTRDRIDRHPICMDGVMYAVVISGAQYPLPYDATETIDLVPLDGIENVKRYAVPSIMTAHPMAIAPCDAEKFGTPFLVYRAGRVYRADSETMKLEVIPDEELYAPLVMINGKSVALGEPINANGVMFEGLNSLTCRYRAQFTSSVEGATAGERYVMPTKLNGQSTVTMHIITPSGETTVQLEVGGEQVAFDIGDGTERYGKATQEYIEISSPLPKSTVSGNVTITAEAFIIDSNTGSVAGATIAAWFGGTQNRFGGTRLFLTGFDKGTGGMGACLMWSDVDNPLYFPQNNYMHIGDTSQRITALDKQEDMLVIFKEREMYYTRYVEGSVDADSVANGTNVDVTVSAAYFPLIQLSPYIGCDAPASIAMCRNRLVWMNQDGRVYMLRTASAYSERNVREIGTKIRNRLLSVTTEAERAKASAADLDGRYYVMVGRRAFTFDYGDTGFINQSSYSSDKRASQHIAWFEHRFDTLPTDAQTAIVSDGADKAVVIVTRHSDSAVCVRQRWYFKEESSDSRVVETSPDIFAMHPVPIECGFTTKQYVFGDATVIKQIKAAYLNMASDGAALRMIVNGEDIGTVRRVRGDGKRSQLIVPGVKRCQSFALSIQGTAPLAVKGLYLQYRHLDVTR